jgi:hypothetical protein
MIRAEADGLASASCAIGVHTALRGIVIVYNCISHADLHRHSMQR